MTGNCLSVLLSGVPSRGQARFVGVISFIFDQTEAWAAAASDSRNGFGRRGDAGVQAEAIQQVLLPFRREADDPTVPTKVDRVVQTIVKILDQHKSENNN